MISLGSDHAGYELKEHIKRYLEEQGVAVSDMGTYGPESVDYPVFGRKVAMEVLEGRAERGIIICGTGIGISMSANRVPGIRAALCTDEYMARMAREHNNANILAMGSRVVGTGLAESIVDVFLHTEFAGGRHAQRVALIDKP